MTDIKRVYDAGPHNTFSLGPDILFKGGLYITSKDSEIEMLNKYMEDTNAEWTVSDYDETNPRHAENIGSSQTQGSHAVTA